MVLGCGDKVLLQRTFGFSVLPWDAAPLGAFPKAGINFTGLGSEHGIHIGIKNFSLEVCLCRGKKP